MAEKANSFLFYRSYVEALEVLPSEKQLNYIKAIFAYALDDIEPEFETAAERGMFTLIKANLDSCDKRYKSSVENGKKGGRPPKKESEKKPNSKPNGNLKNNPAKPNQNLNKDDNDNDDDNYHPLSNISALAGERSLTGAPQPGKPNEYKAFEMAGKKYELLYDENGKKIVREIANDRSDAQ